jgi:uncharacterized protein involved in response to NO
MAENGKPKKLGFAPFFLGAAILAILNVPIWIAGYLGFTADLPETPYWHGHEMLFGYAGAVLGGYLLAKSSWTILIPVFATWIAGRLGFFAPAPVAATTALLYPICLFYFGGIPFIKAAKRARSAIPGLLLAGLMIAEGLFQLGNLGILSGGQGMGLLLGINMITLLLYIMGGRVIAAATSGAHQAKGAYVAGVSQQRLELIGLVLLITMVVADLLSLPGWFAGLAAGLAGTVILVRLIAWKVWRVVDFFDISGLHLGYLLLALGLILKGAALGLEVAGLFEALHGITVGALGILSLSVMGRTILQRGRLPRKYPTTVRIAIAVIALAAALRLLAIAPDWRSDMLIAGAAVWVLAFLMFGGFVVYGVWAAKKA